MGDLVVDTSVVVKWYIPERDHEAARALRDDYLDGEHDLFAPALMPLEAVNALKYSGEYDGERLAEAAASLAEYGIRLVPFHAVGPLADIATEADITAYDAAYIALAVARGTTVYTADGTLVDDLAGSGYEDAVTHVRTY
jgi:predicted nucleic acid-binding protein